MLGLGKHPMDSIRKELGSKINGIYDMITKSSSAQLSVEATRGPDHFGTQTFW